MATLTDTTNPSGRLIAASQVSGTVVYNPQGERLGKIEDLMIDKVSGRIPYAVLSFGGFLGIGDRYYPLPWPQLRYDTGMGGYVVNLDKRMLDNAPSYAAGATPDWNDDTWGRSVYGYYKTDPYWS